MITRVARPKPRLSEPNFAFLVIQKNAVTSGIFASIGSTCGYLRGLGSDCPEDNDSHLNLN